MASASSINQRDHSQEPQGPLWAYPMLFLGATVLGLSLWFGPLPYTGPSGALRRVSQLRDRLQQTDPTDLAEWLEDAEKSAALITQPNIQAQARLLLAEGWLLRAGALPAEEAILRIRQVRQDLEKITDPGLPEENDRRNYLLALARFQAVEDIQGAIELLDKVEDSSPLAAEAYELLAKACLKLPIVDLQGSLKANERLRALGKLTDGQRAQAQLAAGELYLRLQQPEQARRVLGNVGTRAPMPIQTKARLLLAQSFQDQGLWVQAAEAWQAVLDSQTEDDKGDAGHPWFSLGLCLSRAEQPTQAAEAWEQCLRQTPDDSTRAAHLLLGQHQANEVDPQRALGHFSAALDGVTDPMRWRNRLIDLSRVREVLDQTLQVWMRTNQHAAARKLAELNNQVALPSEATVRLAQVLENQARALRDPTGYEKAGGMPKAMALSQALYLEAAAANTKAADVLTDPARKSEHIWLAARQSRDGGDTARAVELLNSYLVTAQGNERSGEAWYLLGDALAAQKKDADSLVAYKECIKYLTPFAYRARDQIGADALRKGNLDGASDTLEHNLQVLRLDPEPQAQELTLYALGSLYYQRRDWRMVMRRLEEALERFPANAQHLKARLLLADAYRQLAAKEHQNFLSGEQITAETREHFQSEHRRWLERAVSTYHEVQLGLALPGGVALLTQGELETIPFLLADTWFNLGRYTEALHLYEEQANILAGRKEQLVALGGSIRCYSALGQFDKVNPALDRISKALPVLDEPTRREWNSWIKAATRVPAN